MFVYETRIHLQQRSCLLQITMIEVVVSMFLFMWLVVVSKQSRCHPSPTASNVSITEWSQEDINKKLICYVMHADTNATSDVIFYAITDSGGNAITDQTFRINWGWVSFNQTLIKVSENKRKLRVTACLMSCTLSPYMPHAPMCCRWKSMLVSLLNMGYDTNHTMDG